MIYWILAILVLALAFHKAAKLDRGEYTLREQEYLEQYYEDLEHSEY